MLDYQCVTEKAVASSRRRNSFRKADTQNFVCGRGSSYLRQSLAEPNDFISPFISPTLSICFTHISWQAIKSPDSLQPSIIMTCTLTKIIDFVRKTGQFYGQSVFGITNCPRENVLVRINH